MRDERLSPDYGPRGNEFDGEVNWVQIDLGEDNHDHLISPVPYRDGAAVSALRASSPNTPAD